MAPERKHSTDTILDTARALLLDGGPRAATMAAISAASGAPPGTLHHRFGTRGAIVAGTWLRAIDRFQRRAQEAARLEAEPVEVAVALARSILAFARADPEDARLLLTLRPEDVLGPRDAARLREMNEPLVRVIGELARDLYGSADLRSRDRVYSAVVDVPYAAIRRHAPPLPGWLEEDVEDAVRRLLGPAGGELKVGGLSRSRP